MECGTAPAALAMLFTSYLHVPSVTVPGWLTLTRPGDRFCRQYGAEGRRRSFALRRHEAVGEFVRHDATFSRTGSVLSISLRRGSRKLGSSRSRPRASTGSSTANPGISV